MADKNKLSYWDCKQENHNFNFHGIDNYYFKSCRTMMLILLQQFCVEKLEQEGDKIFPLTKREKLAKEIKNNLKQMTNYLLLQSPKEFKFLGLALLDYEKTLGSIGDKSNFNKSLADAILYYYRTLVSENEGMKALENNYHQYFKNRGIKLEDKLNKYFEVRKNSNSLYRISTGIKSILESLDPTKNKVTTDEKRLAVQEALRLTGEYLKSTKKTPNLENELVKQLKENGIPVENLTEFRDMLTHGQLFPLIGNERVDEIINKDLRTVKDIIDGLIVKSETDFIRSIINQNFNKIQNQNFKRKIHNKSELNITNEGKNIYNLINALISIKKDKDYPKLLDQDKMLIDEIYENALLMNSNHFSSINIDRVSEIDFSKKGKRIISSIEDEINPSDKLTKLIQKLTEEIKKVGGLESVRDDRFASLCKEIITRSKDQTKLEKQDVTTKSVLTKLRNIGINEAGKQDKIIQHLRDFFSENIKKEFDLLKKLENIYAIKSQILNLFDAVERNDIFVNGKLERKGIIKLPLTRNYLSHDGAFINVGEDLDITGKIARILREGIIKKLESKSITFQVVENAIETTSKEKENEELIKIFGEVRAKICGTQIERRQARSADKSCIMWEEIDKFNEGGIENRDPDNIIIDSEKFLSFISNELEENAEKFSNIIALASESEVVGDYKNKVNMLIDNHRYFGHFEKVEKVSGMVMYGTIAKDVVGDLLRGDYGDVTINLSFLAGSLGLSKIAEVASIKGAGFILEGRVLLGKLLRFAAPFLEKGVNAVIIYDLINKVKKFRKGNKDALVPIIEDSLILGVESIDYGIKAGEILGLLEGVSTVTGPIAVAVEALVFVGSEIYVTVRTVKKIDKLIHLTGWEEVTEGSRAFFGLQPSEGIEMLIEEKEANNQAVNKTIKIFDDHRYIRRYVFPSIRVVRHGSEGKHANETILNNVVLLDQKRNDIKWSRTRPDSLEGINLFCLPIGDWEPVRNGGTYYCDGAIGIEYANNRTGNYTLISLGDGRDIVKGFQDSSNIFVLGDGHKDMTGGNKDDYFTFREKSSNATHDSEINGSLVGHGGINAIDVSGLTPCYEGSMWVGKYQVFADFHQGILKDTSKVALNISNINIFLGRQGRVDQVVFACDTKYMDGKGGENEEYLDAITIPKDDACFYDTKIIVNPYTKVTNSAINGNFTYFIRGEKGTEAYIDVKPSLQSNSMFTFNYTLKDIAAINKSEKNVTFSFVEEYYKRENKLDVNSSFNVTVSGANENVTTYHLIDSTQILMGPNNLYAIQNTEEPIDSLVKDYSSIAEKSQMYVIVHSNAEILTVGHIHHDVLMNDPKANASHLVGSGGENVFVITSGHEKLSLAELPISDVIIYDFDQKNKVDSLNLHEIKEQLKKDIGQKVNTEISKIDNDLLINVSLDYSFFLTMINNFIVDKREVVKIKLKGALENNWYKRVQVVIDNVFVIEEILGNFKLTPQPLIFDDNSKTIYVINPEDVVEGQKIRIKKEIGDYIIARQNDALIITNSLNSNVDNNNLSTIILNDFYYKNNRDVLQTLKIEFNDEKIFLRKKTERINGAENFSELKRKVGFDSYKAVMHTIKEQKMFEAIEGNNIGEVKELINHGVSIDARNNDGQTPLQFAAASGNLEIVRYLILIEEEYANYELGDKSGQTLLQCAAMRDNLEVVKFLIEVKKMGLNKNDDFGQKILYFAAEHGDLEIVKYLTEVKKVGLNEIDNFGQKPLQFAAKSGNLELVKYFIEEKNVLFEEEDEFGQVILHFAADGGDLDIVKYLIEGNKAEFNVTNYDGQTPLHYAALRGRLDVVRYLIEEKDADIYVEDRFGNTALQNIAKSGNLEVLRYLIEKEYADVYVNGRNGMKLVHFAAEGICDISLRSRYTGLEMVKYLIEEKKFGFYAKTDFGQTPMHFAANCGNLEVVKYLIENSAAANVTDNYGRIPLHFATMRGNLEIARYLIEVGNADVNAQCNSGQTPLHYAASSEKRLRYPIEKFGQIDSKKMVEYHIEKGKLVEYLIEKGAKIDLKVDGQTPFNILQSEGYNYLVDSIIKKLTDMLFDAVKYDDFGEIQALINQGVSVNVKNSNGQTLLHYAARDGDLQFVKYLIGKKAHINSKDEDGKIPLDLATEPGIVKFLEQVHMDLDKELLIAVKDDDLSKVEDLVTQGANIRASDFPGSTILRLAYCIKGVLEKINGKEQTSYFEELKSKLPESVKNMVFLSEVCIKNVAHKRYLYSPNKSDNFQFDDYRRYAFTWPSNEKDNNAFKWKVEFNGDSMYLKNVGEKRYLYSPNMYDNFQFDDYRRFVFTWPSNEKDNNAFKWKVEPNDDSVYLMNVGEKRYLYSPNNYSNFQYDNERRYVFTWPSNDGDDDAKWKVEDCKVARRNRRHHIRRENHHRGHHYNSVHFESIVARNRRSVAKVVELSLQNDEIGYNKGKATSGGSKPSSWINDLVGWVRNSIGKLISLPEEKTSSTASSISQIDMQIDADGTIMLLDLLIRKVSGQKYISSAGQNVSLIEAQGYALNITERFEKILKEAAIKSGISTINLNFNPVKTQLAIVGQIRNEKFSEVSKSLYCFVKEACRELEQTDKFLAYSKFCLEEFLGEKDAVLLQQKVEHSDQQLSRKVVAKELHKKPDTLLNEISGVKGLSCVLER